MNTVFTSRQLVKLTELMEQHDMTPDILTKILADGRLADTFAYAQGEVDRTKLHRAFGPLPLPPSTAMFFKDKKLIGGGKPGSFEIEVNYDHSLEEMKLRCNFCNVDERLDLRQHPPHGAPGSGVHKKVVKPLWFGHRRKITIADAKEWYGPNQKDAVIEDLFAFGLRYRSLLKEFAIVAPGSIQSTDSKNSTTYKRVFFMFECEHGGIDIGARELNTTDWTSFPQGALFLTVCK